LCSASEVGGRDAARAAALPCFRAPSATRSDTHKTTSLTFLFFPLTFFLAVASRRALLAASPAPSPGVSTKAIPAAADAKAARAAALANEAVGSASDEPDKGVIVAGQRGVGSIGSAGPADTCAVTLLGAVGGVPVNATDYAAPLPLSAARDKRLAPAPRQAGWTAPRFSKPSSCSAAQYRDIVAAVNDTDAYNLELPGVVRLAFHTCGSFVALDSSGGCDGAWLRFSPDKDAVANGGTVAESVTKLDRIKEKFPCITYADLYTLAGSVAVEVAGGPAVAWSPGRVDADGPGPSHPPYSSRLPDGMFNGAGLAYFMTQWGFSAREAVAVIGGGHSIGGAEPDASGWKMVFTPSNDKWPTPANQYFTLLMNSTWIPAETEDTGLPYYKLAEGEKFAGNDLPDAEGKPVGRLPSDMALRLMKLYAPIAAEYAADEAAFLRDFSFAYEKLLALGSPGVGRQGGAWRWKGFDGKWEGAGADAAYKTLTGDVKAA
jgi:cytochrome c peroxidase